MYFFFFINDKAFLSINFIKSIKTNRLPIKITFHEKINKLLSKRKIKMI